MMDLAVHIYITHEIAFSFLIGCNRGVWRFGGGEGETGDCGAAVWREDGAGGEPKLSPARRAAGQ